MTIWAGYARVSRVGDRAETLISPELQTERIQAYAAARGLQVEMLPAELDVSGGKVERPILGQAIEAIERGEYAGLIVAQLDRLSRMDLPDAVATVRRIENAGGQVISVAENFDATTPEGQMGRNVMFAVADMQLGRYKAQFRAAKQRAVERGIWPVRNVPFGYRKGKNRRLEPGPDARKLRKVFERRAAGAPWSEIQKITGLSQSAGHRIVQNRVYLGELRVGEWVNPEAHPPLVDRALWEAAQLAHPRPAVKGNPPALLAGLVRCAGCGTTMSPSSRGTERDYRCRPNKASWRCPEPALISRGLLDNHVESIVLGHLAGGVAAGAVREADTTQAEAALAAAEAELSEYQRAVSVSGVGAEHFAAGMRDRVAAVETARRDLGQARVAQPTPALEEVESLWPALTVEERRQVLRGAIGVVWVRKGRRNVTERVRIVAAGFEPADLSRPGFRRAELRPVDWEADLPGEIGTPGA